MPASRRSRPSSAALPAALAPLASLAAPAAAATRPTVPAVLARRRDEGSRRSRVPETATIRSDVFGPRLAGADVAANLLDEDLRQAATITAAVLLQTADLDARVPRGPLPAPRAVKVTK